MSRSDLPPGFLADSYVVVDAQSVIRAGELLPDPEYRNLRRDLARVFGDVLIPAKAPGMEIEEVDNLTEIATMLQESVIEWREGWRAEGRKKGLKEGRALGRKEGRTEGEAAVLIRLAEKRYGPLPDWAQGRIEAADADQLLVWAERVLTAKTLDEIFE